MCGGVRDVDVEAGCSQGAVAERAQARVSR
jgi:hypothetical protein